MGDWYLSRVGLTHSSGFKLATQRFGLGRALLIYVLLDEYFIDEKKNTLHNNKYLLRTRAQLCDMLRINNLDIDLFIRQLCDCFNILLIVSEDLYYIGLESNLRYMGDSSERVDLTGIRFSKDYQEFELVMTREFGSRHSIKSRLPYLYLEMKRNQKEFWDTVSSLVRSAKKRSTKNELTDYSFRRYVFVSLLKEYGLLN